MHSAIEVNLGPVDEIVNYFDFLKKILSVWMFHFRFTKKNSKKEKGTKKDKRPFVPNKNAEFFLAFHAEGKKIGNSSHVMPLSLFCISSFMSLLSRH